MLDLENERSRMTLNIESMSESDLPEVLALWEASAGVGLNESDTIEQLSSFLRRNPGLSLIGRHQTEVIAAVLCGHDGRRGYLHHLAVATGYHRRGIGTRLVKQCIDNLRELKILKCNIFVYNDNDEGTDFWCENGWFDRSDLKVMQRLIS